MPLSTLDGDPTTELHEHFDADGNPTGSTIVTRPGWSAQDRAWALALTLREATECPRGHDLTESLDYGWQWQPQPPAVCFACLALEQGAKAYEKDPRARAMLHTVTKRPRPKPKPRKRKGA